MGFYLGFYQRKVARSNLNKLSDCVFPLFCCCWQINLEILKPIHFDGDVRKENRIDFKGTLIKQLSEHTHHVNKLIRINSKVFASASSDKTILIWNPF